MSQNNRAPSFHYSYSYSDMVSEESKLESVKEAKSETYKRNLRAYYTQDSSDYKAVANRKRSEVEIREKYAKYDD